MLPSPPADTLTVSRHPALVLFIALSAASLLAAAAVDMRAIGGIKGDEATYVGMAASLGHDADFVFTAADYQRFRSWYSQGPEGIFLKQDASGALHFGKAYVYGVLAAPFARAGLNGLLAFNLLCLAATIAAGFWWLSTGHRRLPALAASVLFATAAITPLYAAWLTSDLMNYALVFLAFAVGWRRPGEAGVSRVRLVAAAIILAAATFSKPLNALLAVALAAGAGPNWRDWARSLTIFAVVVPALFGLNAVISGGDPNYQGGNRKTFYTHFPYDEDGHRFETSGISRATDAVVELPPEAPGRIGAFPQNLWYFFAGRHFGVLPYGWPWLMAVALWAAGRGKSLAEWALLGAVAATVAITLLWMPYTWSGGGGPVGNRYFLSIAAALFFLLPAGISLGRALTLAVGLVFVMPSLTDPFVVAKQPWLASRAAPFGWLPLELTGAADFPIMLSRERGRMPQGREPTVFVAFLDSAAGVGRSGWIAVLQPARAALLARSPEPLKSVTVGVKTETACDILVATHETTTVRLAAGERQDVVLPVEATFSLDSFAFPITVDTTPCSGGAEFAMQGTRSR